MRALGIGEEYFAYQEPLLVVTFDFNQLEAMWVDDVSLETGLRLSVTPTQGPVSFPMKLLTFPRL